MFDIPIELFAIGLALSLVFTAIAFLVKPRWYIAIFATGIFIIVFSVSTDNLIMGYHVISTTATVNGNTTVSIPITEPINYQFTALPRTLFGLLGAFIMLFGALAIVRDP